MNSFYKLRWYFNVWDGLLCILDVASGIGVQHFCMLDGLSDIAQSEFYILGEILLLGVGIWLLKCFFFGIFDGDYAIWDDYLVF